MLRYAQVCTHVCMYACPPVQVCFSDVESGEMTHMDCGHTFCNTCWAQHIVTQIAEGQARTLR